MKWQELSFIVWYYLPFTGVIIRWKTFPMLTEEDNIADPSFVEDLDFYFENGVMVLSAHFLLKRGYCCQNACRHCPYGFKDSNLTAQESKECP